MSVNWTRDLELLFLELYQTHPIIWDPKERDHKNRYKTYDAWKTISEALNIPIKELKSKKESLMSTFRMHKRKIRSSQTSGAGSADIYTPIWFAYNIMDSFLGDIVECSNSNKTKNTLTATISEITDQDESQDQLQSQETNPPSNDSSSAHAQSSQTTMTIRRRKNPPELSEAGHVFNKTLKTLNDVLQKEQNKNTSQEKEDECDLYGRIFAKKLRKLPEHERISFMYEVDGMFIRRFSRNDPDAMRFPSFTHRSNRPSSTCTSYSEPISLRGMHTPEYQVEERRLSNSSLSYFTTSPPHQHHLSQQQQEVPQERPPSTSGLPYTTTSPQQRQLSQQYIIQERPPSTAEFPYITISPQQHQLSQQHMVQERPQSSVALISTSAQQNISQNPILIHIPEQSQSSGSYVVNPQNSISILSDVTVNPPSDDSSQNYIVEAFDKIQSVTKRCK